MDSRLAKVLSVLFHPLLLPSYLFCLILYGLPAEVLAFPDEGKKYILLLVFLTTFLFPSLATYAMRRAGYVSSMELDEREDRRWPLLFSASCYTITTVLFYQQPYFNHLFFYIMGIITASVYLTLLINQFWKISAHAMGIGGALGILLLVNSWLSEPFLLYPIIVAIALSGALLAARLELNLHTPHQVYAGFGIGLLLGLSLWGLAL